MGPLIDWVGWGEEEGGKQHHISCGDDYKAFNNIIWLNVNSFPITGLEVRVLGLGLGVWMVGFMYTDLTGKNPNMTIYDYF